MVGWENSVGFKISPNNIRIFVYAFYNAHAKDENYPSLIWEVLNSACIVVKLYMWIIIQFQDTNQCNLLIFLTLLMIHPYQY